MVAAKGEFVFVADTLEPSNNLYDHQRIRWSHPGRGTSWRSADFIDIPDGTITAIVPYRDYLAVFTDDAVYGLFGDSTETFSLQPVTTDSGTPFHWSVTASPSTLYWWDWDQGIMSMVGTSPPKSVSNALKPFLRRHGFDPTPFNPFPGAGEPNLLWGEGKLYACFPGLNPNAYPTGLGRLFVFDPSVGRMGAWTTYTMTTARGMALYPRKFKNDLVVAGDTVCEKILNDETFSLDINFQNDATDNLPPQCRVRTAPFVGDTNVTKKRYRRPRVSLRSGTSKQRLKFGYLKDYVEGAAPLHLPIDMDFTATAAANALRWAYAGWSDAFGSQDAVRWTGYDGVNVLTSGGQLNMIAGIGNTRQLTTVQTYNMVGNAFSAEVIQAPTGNNGFQAFSLFKGSNYMRMGIFTATGNIFMDYRNDAGVVSTTSFGPMDLTNLDWWRLRELNGSILWDTSPDGVTWTNRRTVSSPWAWDMKDAKLQFSFSGITAGGSQTVKWDNAAYTVDIPGLFGKWDAQNWAADKATQQGDGTNVDPPNNFMDFRTLPSGGSGHVFQLEFITTGTSLDDASSNSDWGIDSIVLPYREKGIR